MFVLYEMTQDVRIDPINLGQDRTEAIINELNQRLSNRVMLNVGLCMALWDIKSIGSGVIYPGDGGVHSKVVFRYIVFRPFQDEIMVGKIKNCTPDGVHVTLGYFDDILVTPECLQYPSKFDEREQVWIWEYKTEEDDEVHEMYMDKGETIKFRVTGETFNDTTPVPDTNPQGPSKNDPQGSSGPQPGTSKAPAGGQPSNSSGTDNGAPQKIPYSITGSINEPGLGLMSWWS